MTTAHASPSSRLCLLAFAWLALGCAARLPPEPPDRVLELERTLPVILTSVPVDLDVFEVDPSGRVGRRLGTTPVVIDRLQVTKEIWKHGQALPPVVQEADPLLRRSRRPSAEPTTIAAGDPLRWVVWVADPTTGAPRQVCLELPVTELEAGFSAGRLELTVPPLQPAYPAANGDPVR